ncbi:unnamed protein product [Sphenostylis stenocarpa]|uniref:Uncharacterized protein n=1 Tax=Sphenostylis stenocarpa TaxID=92480 RepID=A0AA86W539_9FABA|nr:unnamed protein product [Sphenostylis stenocarpa]
MDESLTEQCRVKTAGDKPEEGEDDVKSSCPLCPGRHTCYNGRDKGSRSREVIGGQPYGDEFVPGPCTHGLWELAMPKVVTLTARRGMSKAGLVTRVKS